MLQNCRRYGLFIAAFLLLIFTIFLFYKHYQNSNRGLTFAMLDVGQGDALFIESPTGTQIIVDVGPPRKIMGKLYRIMSPFDRHIDAIIITNPDQDHIGGLAEILKAYRVDIVFEPGTLTDSKTFQNLKADIKNKNISNVLVRKGMRLDIGGGAVIDVLFPDRDVFDWSTNDGSIVARLTYGETSIMLTGDATENTEKMILAGSSAGELDSDILKVGHHGSRTSTTKDFVDAVSPSYALISNGKENSYGHPHREVLDSLGNVGAYILRTDLLGTIIMKSDGKEETFSFHK